MAKIFNDIQAEQPHTSRRLERRFQLTPRREAEILLITQVVHFYKARSGYDLNRIAAAAVATRVTATEKIESRKAN